MKLNNDIRCLIETLFNRVIDFNERVEKAPVTQGQVDEDNLATAADGWFRAKASEAVLKIEKKGVVLAVVYSHNLVRIDSNYWTREDRCLHIWAETEEDLKSMIQWLDVELAIAEKDEIDPKAETQRELDKEQI
jgi:hypothetical protein